MLRKQFGDPGIKAQQPSGVCITVISSQHVQLSLKGGHGRTSAAPPLSTGRCVKEGESAMMRAKADCTDH